LVQTSYDTFQKIEDKTAYLKERIDRHHDLTLHVNELEKQLWDKAEMRTVASLIERLNKLEDFVGANDISDTNRSLNDDESVAGAETPECAEEEGKGEEGTGMAGVASRKTSKNVVVIPTIKQHVDSGPEIILVDPAEKESYVYSPPKEQQKEIVDKVDVPPRRRVTDDSKQSNRGDYPSKKERSFTQDGLVEQITNKHDVVETYSLMRNVSDQVSQLKPYRL